MVALVKNLQESLGERIKGLSWMGEETKEKALENWRLSMSRSGIRISGKTTLLWK